MSNNIDTLNTEHPVCPYCGYKHRDTDGFEEPATKTCNKCEKEFVCYAWTPGSYTTEPLEEYVLRNIRIRLGFNIEGDMSLLANAAFAYGLENLPLELLQIYNKMLKGEWEQ